MSSRTMLIATACIAAAGLGLLAHFVLAKRFDRETNRAIARLGIAVEAPPARHPASLPPRVREFATRALPRARARGRLVRLRQVGSMWMSEDAEPMAYGAEQWIDIRRPAFVWRAELTVARVVRLAIVDRYVDGRGLLAGRAFRSVPFIRATGPGVDRGEAMRYLAEIVWSPASILDNPHLEWRDLGGGRVEVALGEGRNRASVRLHFDGDGDIVTVRGVRPRRVGGADVDTPWSGTFFDYREINGYRIPIRGEVAWGPETGDYTYWRGEIVDYLVEP